MQPYFWSLLMGVVFPARAQFLVNFQIKGDPIPLTTAHRIAGNFVFYTGRKSYLLMQEME